MSQGAYGPPHPRRKFVLLFDGTGNRFSGTESDSNILKILRMLSQEDPNQVYYYQPGIGTYTQTQSYSHTSTFSRLNSWFQKTRDSAIGSSFDAHVMGGYKFLMKYYTTGDDIYLFGFSRGAYIARFLAKMIDGVGLLGPGQEEMSRFAWKAFAQWEMRLDGTDEEKEKKHEMLQHLIAFRDTFSRPVRRIRFIGLFDTVNSVPRFENAWMQRSKFPYTARSSAIIIRHAVAIDERRAKFRQDLLSEVKHKDSTQHGMAMHRGRTLEKKIKAQLHVPQVEATPHKEESQLPIRYRRTSHSTRSGHLGVQHSRLNSTSPARSPTATTADREHSSAQEIRSVPSESSLHSLPPPPRTTSWEDDEDDENIPQDIQEMWFPGGHADIGGGWQRAPGETVPLSHGPLAWIVREAAKAGLNFDQEKMRKLMIDFSDDYDEGFQIRYDRRGTIVPQVHITSDSPERVSEAVNGNPQPQRSQFHEYLHHGGTKGTIHDCLEVGPECPRGSVIVWRIMEWLPFRRMDLQSDGSWQSIRWPLPKGETRDIPDEAWIHISAIRRMEADPKYRPGNLIIGGGGRGVRFASEEHGIGQWDPMNDAGDPVGECVRRRPKLEGAEQNGNGNVKKKEKEKKRRNGKA